MGGRGEGRGGRVVGVDMRAVNDGHEVVWARFRTVRGAWSLWHAVTQVRERRVFPRVDDPPKVAEMACGALVDIDRARPSSRPDGDQCPPCARRVQRAADRPMRRDADGLLSGA